MPHPDVCNDSGDIDRRQIPRAESSVRRKTAMSSIRVWPALSYAASKSASPSASRAPSAAATPPGRGSDRWTGREERVGHEAAETGDIPLDREVA
jgi:hypothetical protein